MMGFRTLSSWYSCRRLVTCGAVYHGGRMKVLIDATKFRKSSPSRKHQGVQMDRLEPRRLLSSPVIDIAVLGLSVGSDGIHADYKVTGEPVPEVVPIYVAWATGPNPADILTLSHLAIP